jgi:hypothetical protein
MEEEDEALWASNIQNIQDYLSVKHNLSMRSFRTFC